MKVLVINCGSSTIKFQFIDMENKNVLAKGRADMIGYEASNIIYKNVRDRIEKNEDVSMPTHKEAMQVILKLLMDKEEGVINSIDEIYAVGHRVVHGGEIFDKATLVDKDVLDKVAKLSELAPLHNPGAVMGVEAIIEIAPNLPNVVVFDTAFHQTIPDFNYLYAINEKYYKDYKIRRYGAHGTSYKYILERLEELLGKDRNSINAVVCHMGGGASACAIKNGKSYDTSMGFTPLEGFVMETRSGDIDPAAVLRIMEKENLTPEEMNRILNKESGRLGLSGIGDQRALIEASKNGNERAILTRKIQTNRTKKYIGAYMAELGHTDAIVFTGGNGENNADEREYCVSHMKELGVVLDNEKNYASSGKEALISTVDSKVKVFVIPTDEEYEIAKETLEVVAKC